MVEVRLSQIVSQTSESADTDVLLSQVVKQVSYKKLPPFLFISQIVKQVSVEVFEEPFSHFLSQLVRQVSMRVPPIGTACDVQPIEEETDFPVFLRADWGTNVEMETSWQTEITQSKEALAEDRMILMRRPLRTISATLTAAHAWGQDNPARLAKLVARLAKNRNPIPLWQDRCTLGSQVLTSSNELPFATAYRRFYRGQRVGIARPDGQQISGKDILLLEIDSVASDRLYLTSNVPTQLEAGWDVYPMIDCDVVPRTKIALASDAAARTRVTCLEIAGCMTLPASSSEDVSDRFAYIDGSPVLDIHPNWTESVSYEIHREAESIDSGRTQIISPSGERGVEVIDVTFGPLTREQFWDILRFHDSRRGRGRTAWVLHPQTMWTLVGVGVDYLDVRAIGYADDTPEFFQYVGWETADGTIDIRPITSVTTETGPTRHRIHLDALSSTPPFDIVRVTAAIFCRQDTDTLIESWETEDVCRSVKLQFRGLLAEGSVAIE